MKGRFAQQNRKRAALAQDNQRAVGSARPTHARNRAAAFPGGGLVPRQGVHAVFIFGRAIGVRPAAAGGAGGQDNRSEGGQKMGEEFPDHPVLIHHLIAHFNGGGRGAGKDIGHGGLGVDGDRLDFSDHFLAAVNHHG